MKKDKPLQKQKSLHFIAAKFSAIARFSAILILCLVKANVYGQENIQMEHFGAPPFGMTYVELQSKKVIKPIQIVGSLNPSVVLLNGKEIKLKKLSGNDYSKYLKKHKGIWINSKQLKISGKEGRFYTELENTVELVSLEILLIPRKNQILGATISFSPFFLDYPFDKRIIIKGPINDKTFTFQLKGHIPEKSKVEMEQGKITYLTSKKVQYLLEMVPGPLVLTGKLVQQDGTKRIINLPVDVIITKYTKNEPILSLQSISQDFSPFGTQLSGWSNPQGLLTINGKEIALDQEGYFEYIYQPKEVNEVITFKVRTYDGKESIYQKKILCSRCVGEFSWYDPPFRPKGSIYLKANIIQMNMSKLNYFDGHFIGPVLGINLGIGYHYNRRYLIESSLTFLPHYDHQDQADYYPGTISGDFHEDVSLYITCYRQFDDVWYLGGGLVFRSVRSKYKVQYSSFGDDGRMTSALDIRFGHRFYLHRRIEWVPMLKFEWPFEKIINKYELSIDLISMRYYF